MKVLHLYASFSAGGAERLLIILAEALARRSIQSIVACPRGSFLERSASSAGLGTEPFFARGSLDPFGILSLRDIVRRTRPDIMHVHQGKLFWPAIFARSLSGLDCRLVFHRHAQIPHRIWSRSHYRFADRVIAVSRAVAQHLMEHAGLTREQVRVVFNGIDLERFSPAVPAAVVRARYGLEGAFVVGAIGAMNHPKGKGQATMLEAARLLAERYPRIRWLIVGEGDLRPSLERLRARMGLTDRVIFAGQQESVEQYIAAMDISCLLSWDTEAFGQVLVESQAMARPVIGTRVGGIPETMIEGQTGILVDPEDPRALADAVAGLHDDPQRLARMAAAACAFARGHFSRETMARTVAALYREIA